jgi:type IV pilus assembly protein PilW
MNVAMNMKAPSTRMLGLSLIELMIAMTLGLVTIAAVGWIYLGTTKTYRTQDSLARLQEGARFAFEIIGNDLRMTGTTGCSYKHATNVVTSYNTKWQTNLFDQALIAEDQDPAGDFKLSDGLRVLHADISREYLVTNHVGTDITVNNGTGLSNGSVLVATDCNHTSVFNANVASNTISHNSAGNSTNKLGNGGTDYIYSPTAGARIYRLSANTYYVDENAAGEPALFRERLQSNGTVVAEELIEGVEDLQVAFTVDNNGDGVPDSSSDPYFTPEEVSTGAAVSGSLSERWAKVMSVRISMLMRTTEDNVLPEPQSYRFNIDPDDDPIVADDRRLRKVFTHVVKMRNR